ncbi:MAG: heme ABC transporter ATP-binding protein [Thermus sp.]
MGIRIRGLEKRFEQVQALKGVDLWIRYGEVHALLGENGAGKTTLINILYGFYTPDGGEIEVDGQPVRILSPRRAQALGLALVPQHPELVESHTVAENLALGLRLPFWLPRRRLFTLLKERLQESPFPLDLEAPVHALSAGEKQRVEIVRALLQRARVLLLDEPTSVLTPREAQELFEKLQLLKAQGLGVVFISHKLEEVLQVADRITLLRQGEVVARLDREEMARLPREELKQSLVRAMVGREVKPLPAAAPPGERVLLRVEALRVPRFGFPLEGVSFVLKEGEILGVAGVSGSGQKELVEALAGLRPFKGRVEVFGEPLVMDPMALFARGVAHVPEERVEGIVPGMSLVENLALRSYRRFARLGLLNRRALEAWAREKVQAYTIRAPGLWAPIRLLSGGNIQKAILARELEGARILLALHPTYGLDAAATGEVHRLLLQRAKAGLAVLLFSEDLDEILALSHRVAALFHGRLVGPLPRAEVTVERIGRMMTEGVA